VEIQVIQDPLVPLANRVSRVQLVHLVLLESQDLQAVPVQMVIPEMWVSQVLRVIQDLKDKRVR
jgi:hypothetical protein